MCTKFKPYYNHKGITIYHGNCKDILRSMDQESVDLILTSPPYDSIRDYTGYEFDFYNIAIELRNLIKPGGLIVWVVSDQTLNGSETGTSFEQAIFFKKIGLKLHDTMIFQKNAYDPNIHHARYMGVFEYMFVFLKGEKPKAFNPILKKNSCYGNKSGVHKSMQASGKRYVYDVDRKIAKESKRGNIWTYNVGNATGDDKLAFKHPAPFPENLAREHILSWSNEGDVVLDPFLGSGTVLKSAKHTNRSGIGIEIEEEYCKISIRRLSQETLPFGSSISSTKLNSVCSGKSGRNAL